MARLEREGSLFAFETSAIPEVLVAGIAKDPPGTLYPKHSTRHLELNLISSGHSAGILNGAPFVNAAGHIYMYRPGDLHEAKGDPAKGIYTCRWVRFTWPCRQLPMSSRTPRNKGRTGCNRPHIELPRDTALRPSVLKEAQGLFDALLEAHDAGQPGWQTGATGYLLSLMALIQRENAQGGNTRPAGVAIDRRLGQACAYMEQHLARRMKISEMARIAQLSEDYFSRLFRENLGLSPMQYLIRLRLQEGRRVLARHPGLTVREACHQVGFDDPKHFSRLFRKHFGMTPDGFRRQLTSRFEHRH